jgi:hypothetical protein
MERRGSSAAAPDVTMDVDDDDDDDDTGGGDCACARGHARTARTPAAATVASAPLVRRTDGINKAFRAERPAGPPHRCAALLTRQIDRPPARPCPCPARTRTPPLHPPC